MAACEVSILSSEGRGLVQAAMARQTIGNDRGIFTFSLVGEPRRVVAGRLVWRVGTRAALA